MAAYYPWLKGLHVEFMVTWFAGLFYLPRLFVYHARTADAASRGSFEIMEKRLFVIMTIGAAVTVLFGYLLAVLNLAAAGGARCPGRIRHASVSATTAAAAAGLPDTRSSRVRTVRAHRRAA